ncbi:peptidylprolyl isomerase [Carnobacterium maltaromaticum]|uniref:peptidylprolyl isomerase n=1 Tax=Carnobacterium maltaromaticum TaxID=2751 RepID=UPI0015E1465D|nr:peptidylprolyl isomerase [Carnobacterium maltaromaticum]
MKKKLIISGAVFLGLLTAGCTNSSATVASTTAGKVTQEELYQEMKANYGESTLQTMLIEQVLAEKYGDSATTKKINAKFNEVAEMYGDTEAFESILVQYGYANGAAYKATIKQNLLIEAAVKDKTNLTDADYKELWENSLYFQTILVADEDTAKEVITKLDAGEKFKDLATEYSTDTTTSENGGDASFYNTSTGTTYDTSVTDAAAKLNDGDFTKTAISTDAGFYIINMVVNPTSTSKTWQDYQAELKETAVTANLADSTFTTEIMTTLLKAANVQIKDSDLENALSAYLTPTTTTSSTIDSE